MKIVVIAVCIFLFLYSSSIQIFACTSFAVNSEKKLYGMNFDYADVDIKFAISKKRDKKFFHMDFDISGKFSTTVGMNNKGLFTAMQMLYPEKEIVKKLRNNNIDMHDFAIKMLREYDTVADVEKFIKDKRIVNKYVTSHNLFADSTGNAMVVEAGLKENQISKIEDKYIVMTNFANSELKGKSYHDIFGVGADRYKMAYEQIKNNVDSFDLDKGFDTLKKTVQQYGAYPTQASMIFDPEKKEIYIVIKRDFEKVWKVSIGEGTIETFKGFNEPLKINLTQEGILATDLINKNGIGIKKDSSKKLEKTSSSNFFLNLIIFVFALLAISITTVIFRKRKK